MICDFCSLPDPIWEYPAESFVDAFGSQSVSDWMACDTCHGLIEAGNRDGLATRALLTPTAIAGLKTGMLKRKFAIRYARDLHDGFFAHRRGPARPKTQCTKNTEQQISVAQSKPPESGGN